MTLRLQNRFQVLSEPEQDESNTRDRQQGKTLSFPTSLAKTYFKLFQTVHHLEILNSAFQNKQLPPGMTKQVIKLTTFIKPACPNSTTRERVSNMTNNWMKEILKILIEHYEQTKSTLLDIREPFHADAFDRATSWAKARYKRKFTNSSVDTVKALLLSDQIGDPPLTSSPVIPIMGRQLSVSANVIGTSSSPVVGPVLEPFAPQDSLGVELGPSENSFRGIEEQPVNRTSTTTPPVTERVLPLEPNTSIGDGINGKTGAGRVTPRVVLNKLPNTNTSVHRVNFDLILSSPIGSNQSGEPPGVLTNQDPEMSGTGMTGPNVQVDNQTIQPQSESTSSIRMDPGSPPGGDPTFFPTRHTRQNWALTVEKPIIFLGDSNLSRIPKFSNGNIQIDSFPGATFHHLTQIVKEVPVNEQVQLLVISVGILNCYKLHDPITIWKQFQDLHRTCKTIFPKALIYIAQITCSSSLDQGVIDRAHDFNNRVQNKCRHFLPILDAQDFQVNARDKIHWLKKTAIAMFDFWMGCLNSLEGMKVLPARR